MANFFKITVITTYLFLVYAPVHAGPVGNFHNTTLWGKGVKSEKQYLVPVFSVLFDVQHNNLRHQTTRFPKDVDTDSVEEIRHYDKTRSSVMEFDYWGLQIDFPLNDQLVLYGMFGITNNTIDFSYTDTSIKKFSGAGFTDNHSFKSNGDMSWGGGVKAVFFQGDLFGVRNCRFGGDLFYRRLNAKDDITSDDKWVSYTTTMDELQIAFAVSTDLYDFQPYAAFRFSSITGDETYMNSLVDIIYSDNIITQRNLGWVIGCGYDISWLAHINLETRIGDESGVGLQFSFKY